MKLFAFDLETTSTDTREAKVCQAAAVTCPADVVEGRLVFDAAQAESESILCRVDHMPVGAQAVHGISAESTRECDRFGVYVSGLAESMESEYTIVVTYNGARYDLPIVERELGRPLRVQHVDVYVAWKRAQMKGLSVTLPGGCVLPCDVFSGSLAGAHAAYAGQGFDGAHDATVDCTATLETLAPMPFALADLLRWTTLPLLGTVEFSGKFKWTCDQAAFAFGKHRGTPIEDVDAGYLRWMLNKGDFPADTCALIRDFLAGTYPVRNYEDET